MIRAAATGALADGGKGPFELAEMRKWPSERIVRAAVLRYLLIQPDWRVDVRGVRLRGVQISGCLDLEAATLRCPLLLEDCYLSDSDPVNLNQATAPRLSLIGCQLAGLTAELLTARGLDLSGSTLTGPLLLRSAHIAGQLSCSGARLTGRDDDGCALVADGMEADGDVLLHEFAAAGAVRLANARIAGQLRCSGARLAGRDRDGYALVADAMTITGDVFMGHGFTADGAVRLAGARIGGNLVCDGALLADGDYAGNALVANQVAVGGSVYLGRGFGAAGTVSLVSAQVAGSVGLRDSRLAVAEDGVAFDATGAQIAGTLRWAPSQQVRGRVRLENAGVGEVADEWTPETAKANGNWPDGGRLHLNGFTYGKFGGDHQATLAQRLGWIRSQYRVAGQDKRLGLFPAREWSGFSVQPYEQLAIAYRQAGQDSQARRAAIASQVDRRTCGNLSPAGWVGNWLLDKTIKYGYQNWRAVALLVGAYAAVVALTVIAQHHHVIVPVGAFKGPAPSATHCTTNYPCFYPAIYAVDVVIPVINVHQAAYWGIDGHARLGWAWVGGTSVATVFGWVAATFLIAGMSALIRQR